MPALLLEREATLAALSRAVTGAAAGQGSVAVVTGEAGIGKTSLIRAFAREAGEHARILLSACDDLMAPRTLGPLRDAALGRDGPLAAALADDEPVEDVFTALLEELAAEPPTVLVVEDLHWSDDATLDVLAYAARRVEAAGALLVLTYRDDEVDPGHPLQRLLGVLASCPVHRLELTALSREAVRRLSAGTGADPEAVHRITRGNPFFVTEALASPRDAVPATVVEAVLARIGRLGDDCRQALDQLSVVPSHMSLDLAAELLGPRIDALAEAEPAGVIDVRPDSLAFRHELTRRAIERSLPALRRRSLNAAVVAVLRAHPRPEPARVMHHAVEANDVETILSVGPSAAREAERAGSHRQALAHYESMRPHLHRVPARDRAALLDGYGWELYNAHRFRDAVAAGREAAGLYEQLGEPVALGECLVRTSRHLFMAGETDEAERCAIRALAILEPAGDEAALAHASLYTGAILALTDDPARAERLLERARELAELSGRPDLSALALNYLGIARTELGDPSGLALLRRSVEVAIAARRHEYAARGYCNLAEMLGRGGRLDELALVVDEGLRFARERGFWSHAYNLEVHRCVVLVRRGRLGEAESGLRELVEGVDDPGCSTPTACRGSAACSRAAATPRRATCSRRHGSAPSGSGCCSASPTPGSRGWSGRGWPASRRWPGAWPASCCRTRPIPAARRGGPSSCATSSAPAFPPSRSRAALSRGRRACAATGARRQPAGRRPATRTSRRSSSPGRASRSRPSRACASSTGSAPPPPQTGRASACGRWARASRGVRGRRRGRTPRA